MISRGLIEYPSERNTHYGGKDKVLPNRSQAKNSVLPNPQELFGRIEEALGTTVKTEIARAVGIQPSSVNEWPTTGKIKLEHLITIARKSGRSLDWILGLTESDEKEETGGEGETRIEFSGSELIYIQKLAESEKKDYEGMVYTLVVEALKTRSSILFSNYNLIPPEQLDDLLSYVLPHNNGRRKGSR